jgi:hypothetical protein
MEFTDVLLEQVVECDPHELKLSSKLAALCSAKVCNANKEGHDY